MASEYTYAVTYSTFLFIVVVLLALVFGGTGTSALTFVKGSTRTMTTWVVSMIPYILLGWGLLMSFLTLQVQYLVPTLVGSAALVGSTVGAFVFGKFLPMFVASTSAILTYYTYDYMVEHKDDNPMKNVMAAIWSFLVLLAQVLCTKPAVPGTYLFNASLMNDGVAALFGISVGLAGWFTTSSVDHTLLPYTGNKSVSVPSPNAILPSPSPTSGAPS